MAKTKYTRQKDGYFQTKVWDGTYVNGKKHYITLRSDKSSRDLEQKVIAHNEKIQNREYVRKVDSTFQQYALAWINVYKAHLAHNTKMMYLNIVQKHFDVLNVPISTLSRAHYITMINSIEGDRTKQQAQLTFKQVLKSAIHDKLLPCSALDEILEDTIKVKYKAPDKRALTEAEKNAISLCEFTDRRDEVFLKLLYYTGMRGEETRALTVFDFNFERKEISVTKAVTFDGNNPLLKDTKNGVHRVLPIPAALEGTLKPYLKNLKGTVLFSQRGGGYLSKSAYRRMWDRVLCEINDKSTEPVTGLTPHIFRHNYCACLCNQIPAISIPKIAELLGDSEKMVIEVYNHEVAGKEKPHDVVADALAL